MAEIYEDYINNGLNTQRFDVVEDIIRQIKNKYGKGRYVFVRDENDDVDEIEVE